MSSQFHSVRCRRSAVLAHQGIDQQTGRVGQGDGLPEVLLGGLARTDVLVSEVTLTGGEPDDVPVDSPFAAGLSNGMPSRTLTDPPAIPHWELVY